MAKVRVKVTFKQFLELIHTCAIGSHITLTGEEIYLNKFYQEIGAKDADGNYFLFDDRG